MEAQLFLRLLATTASGIRSALSVLSGLVWEICQFWQFRQAKLHPAVAMEKALDWGRK